VIECVPLVEGASSSCISTWLGVGGKRSKLGGGPRKEAEISHGSIPKDCKLKYLESLTSGARYELGKYRGEK